MAVLDERVEISAIGPSWSGGEVFFSHLGAAARVGPRSPSSASSFWTCILPALSLRVVGGASGCRVAGVPRRPRRSESGDALRSLPKRIAAGGPAHQRRLGVVALWLSLPTIQRFETLMVCLLAVHKRLKEFLCREADAKTPLD